MKQISCTELYRQLQQNAPLQLIDVRELSEHQAYNIGGTLIPLGDIIQQEGRVPNDRPVVLYCRKGVRSAIAIQRLEEKFGFTNLVNLQGGMDAWQRMLGSVK